MDDMMRLAADLDRKVSTISHRCRGATAPAVDRIASAAQQAALQQWTTYGRGMAGAAGTIRARMSRERGQVRAYILAEGAGVHQSIFGTSEHAPADVFTPAIEAHERGWDEGILDAGSDLV